MTVLFVIQDAADIVSTLQAASAPQLLSFQVFVSERRSDRGQVFVSSGADDFPITRREALHTKVRLETDQQEYRRIGGSERRAWSQTTAGPCPVNRQTGKQRAVRGSVLYQTYR